MHEVISSSLTVPTTQKEGTCKGTLFLRGGDVPRAERAHCRICRLSYQNKHTPCRHSPYKPILFSVLSHINAYCLYKHSFARNNGNLIASFSISSYFKIFRCYKYQNKKSIILYNIEVFYIFCRIYKIKNKILYNLRSSYK